MDTKLSLYIHYPYCVRKCPYCDFNSHKKGVNMDESYFDRLIQDFDTNIDKIKDREFISVFVGGGTPSLASYKCYAKLFSHIEKYFAKDVEITFEANPGTLDLKKLCNFKAVGFNRISIGVQSFDNKMLKALGRIHDKDEAIKACEDSKKAGFLRRNFDIMHTLPGQSTAMALDDLKMAVNLDATHLSWYELTIEEDTKFGQNPPTLPDEDTMMDIEKEGFSYLNDNGFKRYEVSAFTRERRCVHNENYWLFGDYLGIGAGAHSKLTIGNDVLRRANISIPDNYCKKDFEPFYCVDKKDLPFEYMLNRLRLFGSIKKSDFTEKTRMPFVAVEDKLLKARDLGLISFDTDNTYSITELGKIMLNDILELFL